MADWCSVDVLQPDGSLSLIAVAHVDPAKVEWARELRRRFPTDATDTSGVANVARTGVSELVPEITKELIDAANITDPELLDIVERLQLSSVMYIPLIARGRILGALTMVWAESGKHYSEDDLRLGEDLASRAAFAIDNARLVSGAGSRRSLAARTAVAEDAPGSQASTWRPDICRRGTSSRLEGTSTTCSRWTMAAGRP